MPMCDAYIPKDALSADIERELIHRVSELITVHEMRRIFDISKDPESIKARLPHRVWVHHDAEVYVNGQKREEPYYKFMVYVPEGQADDIFRVAVSRDVTRAVADAEGGRWPNPEVRVWVFMWEVPDGIWGSRGVPLGLKDMITIVAPDLPDYADQRLAEHRRDQAVAILEAAGVKSDAVR